jgi:hypothetical protein
LRQRILARILFSRILLLKDPPARILQQGSFSKDPPARILFARILYARILFARILQQASLQGSSFARILFGMDLLKDPLLQRFLQKSSSSLILKTLKRFWLGSSRARILKNLWSGFV